MGLNVTVTENAESLALCHPNFLMLKWQLCPQLPYGAAIPRGSHNHGSIKMTCQVIQPRGHCISRCMSRFRPTAKHVRGYSVEELPYGPTSINLKFTAVNREMRTFLLALIFELLYRGGFGVLDNNALYVQCLKQCIFNIDLCKKKCDDNFVSSKLLKKNIFIENISTFSLNMTYIIL